MFTEKRLIKEADLIKQRGSVSVQELMEYFQVSDMTIRRDLQKLEASGKFQRFHGGFAFSMKHHWSREMACSWTRRNESLSIV